MRLDRTFEIIAEMMEEKENGKLEKDAFHSFKEKWMEKKHEEENKNEGGKNG